ncbi:MAG TPA: alpha/beta hydrolase [Actinomycetota bacterium]|nr:alpha/beta hydrolase [Actinomycetota bacterium]
MPGTIPPPEPRAVDLDGPVRYVEWEGPAGRTFVLVHGLGGSHANWMLVGPGLAAHGRVLALDLPGFGRTPLAGRSPGLASLRATLSAFVREVAGGRAVIAGNSMGGTLAILQGALEPDTVEGLVLTGPALPISRAAVPSPVALGSFTLYRVPVVGEFVVSQRFARVPPELQVRIGFRILAGDPRAIGEEVVRAHAEILREHAHDPEAAAAFVGAARSLLRLLWRPRAYRHLMARVRAPVLLLHGRRDPLVPVAYARQAVMENPSWRLRVFPGLGHVPQLEDPERWLARVEAWLADELPAPVPEAAPTLPART